MPPHRNQSGVLLSAGADPSAFRRAEIRRPFGLGPLIPISSGLLVAPESAVDDLPDPADPALPSHRDDHQGRSGPQPGAAVATYPLSPWRRKSASKPPARYWTRATRPPVKPLVLQMPTACSAELAPATQLG